MVWDDKSKYEGDWKDGMRHGKGTSTILTATSNVGDWKDDVQDGKGIYYFQNGERYEAIMPTANAREGVSIRIRTVTNT